MKAATITGYGGVEVFEYGDCAVPEPQEGEVLVKVLACGINHYDIFLRRGNVTRELALPHVMGADVIGRVEQLGSGVSQFHIGDRVLVAPGYPLDPKEYNFEPVNLARSYCVTGGLRWGGYAQYMCAPARFVIADPPDLPDAQLASLPLVLVTAVHSTRTLAHVGPSQRVLIQAGASGSGSMCIQVAKALGAQVATTVGADDKREFASSVGADVVINHRSEDFVERVKSWTDNEGVDAVVDNVGGSVFEGNIKVLKRGGHLVNFGMVGGRSAEIVFPLLFYKQIHIHGSMMGTEEELSWGLDAVREGRIKPIVDRTMPLDEVGHAHQYIEQRKVKGKVVLLPW